MSQNYLSKNDELRRGDYIISNNREFKAVFQDDGNFVIYGWKPIWSSDTASSEPHRLCMQADCNFVMYKKNGHPIWNTKTYECRSNMCRAHLKDNGFLVLETESEEIWTSESSKGMKN
ncbi:B-type lectin plumieribetin-like [Conger conger]|uniref:B-type lectin plumieribetin-like n=1 Tax=Conger conger TaxID=82655 RepID=UPI002A59FE94|nr:B-type lectin plumieribetin-like [Conger conger]